MKQTPTIARWKDSLSATETVAVTTVAAITAIATTATAAASVTTTASAEATITTTTGAAASVVRHVDRLLLGVNRGEVWL